MWMVVEMKVEAVYEMMKVLPELKLVNAYMKIVTLKLE